ncbi:hypothetical protein Trydic_g21707 [Trypoxylus dichotomus]
MVQRIQRRLTNSVLGGSVSDETIAKVEEAMLKDRKVTVRKVCEMIRNISKICIDKILANHLRTSILTKRVHFHQDDVYPDTVRLTIDLTSKFRCVTATHLPYSPDITPSDYYIFPELKKHLGGTHFKTEEELTKEVSSYEFYDLGIRKMVRRMQKCINLNGDYVEK